ncbi:MAG: DNA polymerase I, partial [Lachnospiraceae bacterium]|nr:DNA polymerase I [Lachnospiraceae bacterium]
LADQFDLCPAILKRMGIAEFMDPHYEADDFSGSLAARFEKELPVRILTRDHDYLQLVNENTRLWLTLTSDEKVQEFLKKYGIEDNPAPEKSVELTPELVEKEFSVLPCHVNSLKGLQGDSSDNIPGVPGIGPQTAVRLIARYGTVDALYEELKDLTPEKEAALKKEWKEELGITRSPLPYLVKESDTELVGEQAARLSEKLATIRTDIDLSGLSLDDLKVRIDVQETEKILNELEIQTLKADFGEESASRSVSLSCTVIDAFDEAIRAVETLKREPVLGVCFREDTGLALLKETGEGYLLQSGFFLTPAWFSDALKSLFEAGVRLAAFQGKELYKQLGFAADDVSVMAYLLDPLSGSYDPSALSSSILNEPYRTEGEPASALENEAFLASRLFPVFLSALRGKGMEKLYFEIEKPTMQVLADLEETGIRVERAELARYAETLETELNKMEQEIYALAGESFNINSPKQLGEILFVKLKLPYGKKTKTGYSTSADVLEELRPKSELVDRILNYRAYSKLLSTYAKGLVDYIHADGRIYGKFHQTVTATGRISSSDPNLQNIPVRTELGRSIRKVFVPEPGSVFIDADYSQIELRVLAHLSNDHTLIEAYNESRDIHALTASQVFHVPLSEVTPLQRRNAKAVNFGIVYGISAFSLSGDLSISRKEAEEYMNRYFETYPEVHSYLRNAVESAKRDGYCTTMFGRIRPIPELSSSNFNQRSFGERVAMNAPIQGTAADIMKIAVIRVSRALKEAGLRSRIVLQVHDEILLEAPAEEADRAEEILVREMEQAASLRVKLSVEAKRGNSWYETK